MRKRTLVDLFLLGLLLTVAVQVWRPRIFRFFPFSPPSDAEPQPTPRMQGFMRRGGPELAAVPPVQPPGASTFPDPAEENPAWLILHVRTMADTVPEGALWISNEDGSFQQLVENGRLALQLPPGPARFFARLTDEFGTRSSRTAGLDLSAGEAQQLVLRIPDPELRSPGITLQGGELYAEVTAVTPGSPAALAGLQAGDAILAIDRVPVAGLGAGQLETLLLGPATQPVILRLVIRNEAGDFEELEALIAR